MFSGFKQDPCGASFECSRCKGDLVPVTSLLANPTRCFEGWQCVKCKIQYEATDSSADAVRLGTKTPWIGLGATEASTQGRNGGVYPVVTLSVTRSASLAVRWHGGPVLTLDPEEARILGTMFLRAQAWQRNRMAYLAGDHVMLAQRDEMGTVWLERGRGPGCHGLRERRKMRATTVRKARACGCGNKVDVGAILWVTDRSWESGGASEFCDLCIQGALAKQSDLVCALLKVVPVTPRPEATPLSR